MNADLYPVSKLLFLASFHLALLLGIVTQILEQSAISAAKLRCLAKSRSYDLFLLCDTEERESVKYETEYI